MTEQTSYESGRLQADDVVSGPGLERLAAGLAGRCRMLDASAWRPRAAEVGRLGVEQAADGRFADPWSLEPRYLRRLLKIRRLEESF